MDTIDLANIHLEDSPGKAPGFNTAGVTKWDTVAWPSSVLDLHVIKL